MTAPMDKSENPAPQAENTTSSQALSAQVFSSPLDFLATIKNDFNQISGSSQNAITQNDLVLYSEQGSDPKGRAAAAIAAQNFTAFANLSNVDYTRSNGSPVVTNGAVSMADLDKDAQYYQGKVLGDQITTAAGDGSLALVFGVESAALALASIGTPLAPVGIAVAIGSAGIAGVNGYSAITDPGVIQRTADRDQANLNSWIK